MIGPSEDGTSREVICREVVTIDKRPPLHSDRECRRLPKVYAA